MDRRGHPMYQNPKMAMMKQSCIGSVPGSVSINNTIGNNTQETMTMSNSPLPNNHTTFTHKTRLNKMPVEQNYTQLPLRKEVDDEGRICSLALPETPAQHSNEGNSFGFDVSQEIKTEENDVSYFMKSAYDILLKISSKELTIKEAADLVGRPYSFVYKRYQEFCEDSRRESCDSDTDYVLPVRKKKKAPIKSKKGKKKKGTKKTNWGNNKTKKKYKCENCPGVYYTDYQIKTHAKVHEEGCESHTCTVCGIVFAKLFHMMRHRIEIHEEALQCPHCDNTFTKVSSYRSHVRNHTGEKPYKCKECGKAYSSKLHLEHHVRTHTGERPYMCGYCEKTFISLGNLKAHNRIHTETLDERRKDKYGKVRIKNKPYPCNECGKMYESITNLEQHVNTHSNARPYACDECDARFNFKAGLSYHKMTHTGIHPFKCDLCPAGFFKKIQLEQHKVMHTGVNPFNCDLCDYSCTRKETLEYHKYTHSGETPFKCDFYGCTAAYAKPASLRRHKLQHGQPPRTCKYCHEKFQDLASLKRHIMIHTGEKPVSCKQCDKTFYEKASLKRHMYSHMYKPPGTKAKQVRPARKNPGTKRKDKPVITQQKWESEYQVPTVSENGLNIFPTSLNATVQNTNNQPSYHFTASQYSSMSAWPSAMNPDELRQRLLSSFK